MFEMKIFGDAIFRKLYPGVFPFNFIWAGPGDVGDHWKDTDEAKEARKLLGLPDNPHELGCREIGEYYP